MVSYLSVGRKKEEPRKKDGEMRFQLSWKPWLFVAVSLSASGHRLT